MYSKLSIIISVILVTAAILTVQSPSSSMLQSSYAQSCPEGAPVDASGNCPTDVPPPAGDEETAQAPPPPATTETPPPPATQAPPPANASQGSNNTGGMSADFVNTILEIHNSERAAVGVPPLVWSDSLAASAQTWAEHVATINEMVHSTGQPYGENIAGFTHGCGLSSLVPPLDYNKVVCPGDTLRTMVMSWVNEKTLYHGGVLTQQNWYPTGHYTQVVWGTTTQIGCGMATASVMNYPNDYLVCQYSPGGNIMGQAPYGQGAPPPPGATNVTAPAAVVEEQNTLCQNLVSSLCHDDQGAPPPVVGEEQNTPGDQGAVQ
jgi:hypothetical protein